MRKLIAASLLALCANAHAEFRDGNDLYEDIRNSSYYMQGVAMGYIMGVTDSLRGITHCIAENATAGQIQDMVKQYLEENPGVRHLTANVLISRVLSRTWPCPKKGGSL
jgi:hypothetical protein